MSGDDGYDNANGPQQYDANSSDIASIKLPNTNLPFWSPLFGYTPAYYQQKMAAIVKSASERANRIVSQEEADILCQALAKQTYIESIDYPLSLLLGAALAYRTRRTFRFPLSGPPRLDRFTPHAFPTFHYPFVTGNSAVAAWHVTRYIAYTTFSWFGIGLFTDSYAAVSFNFSLNMDDRLKKLRNDFKLNEKSPATLRSGNAQSNSRLDKAPVSQRRRIEAAIAAIEARLETLPTEEQVRAGSFSALQAKIILKTRQEGTKALEYAQEALRVLEAQGDDAENAPDQRRDYDTLNASNKPTPSGEYTWQADSGTMPQRNQASVTERTPPPAEQVSTPQPLDDDFDDDASPIASSAREASTAAASGGSAWDRVRRQANPGVKPEQEAASPASQGTWASEAKPRAAGDPKDGFTFSQADEDEALAKAQAQKEFDDMLDRERRGEETRTAGRGGRSSSW